MKKLKAMSTAELSSFCMELSLLLHAGYPMGEGLHLLHGETQHPVLGELCRQVDAGVKLSTALRETGVFPDHLCHMAETGERTGRSEEAFRALSIYYENRRQLSRRIRDALLYPVVLLLLMLVVIAVLLTKVLPVFNDVFCQLGATMMGLAGGLLHFGQALDAALPFVGVGLAALVLGAAAVWILPQLRANFLRAWQRAFGARGIAQKIANARFSSTLSMGLLSGLPMEESLRMASSIQQENPVLRRRMSDCMARLEGGASLAEAIQQSNILPQTYCRMLALGLHSGSGDVVMEEISRRVEAEAEEAIESLVSCVEPIIVLITSVLVGVILLSVMLPLMNIMSAIG